MIGIFKSKKKIVLDCFTFLEHAFDYAKIDRALNYIPSWWKETPAILKDKDLLTIKKCPGVVDFYRNGIVIPSWFELELTVSKKEGKEWTWQASTNLETSHSHSNDQFELFAGEFGHNVKITSPWAFKTNKNINFVWSQPTWNMRDSMFNMNLLPAVVNFKEQYATNINFFVENKETDQVCKIGALTPLVILHPMSECDIEIQNHLISKEEFYRMKNGINNFFFSRNAKDDLLKRKKRLKILEKIGEL